VTHQTEWTWYILCAIAALVWKCFRYCYIGAFRLGKPWSRCLREWFELVTIDSQISWMATCFLVWGFGSAFITGVGFSWIFGGALAGIPVTAWSAGLFGVLMENIAPAFLKWIFSKIPFLDSGGSR